MFFFLFAGMLGYEAFSADLEIGLNGLGRFDGIMFGMFIVVFIVQLDKYWSI